MFSDKLHSPAHFFFSVSPGAILHNSCIAYTQAAIKVRYLETFSLGNVIMIFMTWEFEIQHENLIIHWSIAHCMSMTRLVNINNRDSLVLGESMRTESSQVKVHWTYPCSSIAPMQCCWGVWSRAAEMGVAAGSHPET